ncbi:MAG TPA: MOSC domain-containing protein [Phycisphaerae bacterium]|nr:MOSC domain-containing protein [Phycisphaerae bacterium]
MKGELLSVQVGKVQRLVMPENARIDSRHPFWTSGIFKSAVEGKVRVTRLAVAGDEQADPENHGGPDNVVLACDADHYPVWREELAMPELAFGGFGENFTVRGFSDHAVCIGDVWRVGPELMLQVTQARQPCFKLARRLRQPEIVKRVKETSWGGWYLRVLHEGFAERGMKIELMERVHPEWTVARAVQTMYARKKDVGPARELAGLPELSERWKRELVEE